MHLAQLPVRPLPELERLMSLRGGFGGVVEATSQGDVWFAGLSALIQQTTLYLGTGMAAMAGTITAGSKEMDLFGCVIVGCITAIGGGTLRDIILGRSVYWLQDRTHLNISLAVSIAIFLTWPFLKSLVRGPFLTTRPWTSRGRLAAALDRAFSPDMCRSSDDRAAYSPRTPSAGQGPW